MGQHTIYCGTSTSIVLVRLEKCRNGPDDNLDSIDIKAGNDNLANEGKVRIILTLLGLVGGSWLEPGVFA